MKLKRIILTFFGVVICVVLLVGCKEGGKADYTLSENSCGSETASSIDTISEDVNNQYIHDGSFESIDGKVVFDWDVILNAVALPMQIVNTSPRFYLGEDIKTIVCSLLGEDAIYYEYGPKSLRQLSKCEIENRMEILGPYTDDNLCKSTLRNNYSSSDVQKQLKTYRNSYLNAPDYYSYQLCDWKLKKSSYYNDTNEFSLDSSNMNRLKVIAFLGKRDYYISAAVENTDESQYNIITMQLGDGTDPILRDIQIADMCFLSEPTQEQIDELKEKAQSYLNQLDLGVYNVVAAKPIPLSYGTIPRYAISIKATQVLHGIPVIADQSVITSGIDNLNLESGNDANYPFTNIRFIFGEHGEIIEFTMEGILYNGDIKAGASENLTMKAMCEAVEKHFSKISFDDFDAMTGNNAWEIELFTNFPKEKMCFSVDINNVQFGLARKMLSSNTFEYLPTAVFSGNISCIDSETGNVLRQVSRSLLLVSTTSGEIVY